jgi:hypothetical protein
LGFSERARWDDELRNRSRFGFYEPQSVADNVEGLDWITGAIIPVDGSKFKCGVYAGGQLRHRHIGSVGSVRFDRLDKSKLHQQAGYAETGQLPNERSTLALLFLKAQSIPRVNGQRFAYPDGDIDSFSYQLR